MKHNLHKKISVPFLGIALLIVGGLSIRHITPNVFAQTTSGNVTGYASSTNFGTIDMNCSNTNCTVQFGVNVNEATGVFSGYAWSDTVGWIKFQSNSCGTAPMMNTTTGKVTGWAQAISPTQWTSPSEHGGWSGCIQLSGSTVSSQQAYGVQIDLNTGTFSGSGWSGDDVTGDNIPDIGGGWINFSGAQLNLNQTASISLFTNPSFSGSCGSNATLNWTLNNVIDNPCTMYINGVQDQTINAGTSTSINYPITNSSQAEVFVMKCEDANQPGTIISSNPVSLQCSQATECNDGADNDRDRRVDMNDSSCHTDCNVNNLGTYNPSINDESRVCIGTTTTQCSDGLDNDGDNNTDRGDSSCHTDCNENNPNSYGPLFNDEAYVCDPNDPPIYPPANPGGTGTGAPPIYIES